MSETRPCVVTVAGTRPELIKLAPLVPLLDAHLRHHYLFTGQHYSPHMVDVFLRELASRPPDIRLEVRSSALTPLVRACHQTLSTLRPDVVLVYGDTRSTLAAARASHALGLRLLHLEAGIRCFDRSLPEERSRVEVDRLSHLRLAPSTLAASNLTRLEGYPARSCPVVGNLVVDTWLRHRPLWQARALPAPLQHLRHPFALLTLHRQATVESRPLLAHVLGAIASLDLPVFVPVHPRTRHRLEDHHLHWPRNVIPSPPLGYLDLQRVMAAAAVVLTDSGGLQEEALCHRVPCVTLRRNTERQETLTLGANHLWDPRGAAPLAPLVQQARAARPPRGPNPYGAGHSARRVTALLQLLLGEEPGVTFPHEPGMVSLEGLREAVGAMG